MAITEQELKRLEALCDAASPGPWIGSRCSLRGADGGLLEADEDFALAAESRTALPAAIAEIRRLRGLVYIGGEHAEHEFPDLTWKARCEEEVAEGRRLKAELREIADLWAGDDDLVTGSGPFEKWLAARRANRAGWHASHEMRLIGPDGDGTWMCSRCDALDGEPSASAPCSWAVKRDHAALVAAEHWICACGKVSGLGLDTMRDHLTRCPGPAKLTT